MPSQNIGRLAMHSTDDSEVYISNIPANDMSYVTKMPYNFPNKTILLEALE